jgi:hypothetical protein
VPPRLVLNKLDLYFPTTGLLILRSTVFLVVLIACAVDSIVVLDEGVARDGREAIVPRLGTRTLILSRRGCDGIRHVVMEDEKGKWNKVSKEGCCVDAGRQKKEAVKKRGSDKIGAMTDEEKEREEGGGKERERRGGDGTGTRKGTRGRWRGRAFWNGKVFLVGRRRPSWAKKEQAIYISKQPISKITSPRLLLWSFPSFFILRLNR